MIRHLRALGALIFPLLLVACEAPTPHPQMSPLPELQDNAGIASPRIDGRVGAPDAMRAPVYSYATSASTGRPARAAITESGGSFSLNFADTDIRDVITEILGTMLRVNYTIDPAVRGSVTLRTSQPIPREALLPALQSALSQNGAVLQQTGQLYRVSLATSGNGSVSAPATGGIVVPLRYAVAEELAKVLQPYVGSGGKVIPDPARNALLISADGEGRDALLDLVEAFDVDILAGQSYALLPVNAGGVKEFVVALQEAFRGRGDKLASMVRVVPLEQINSVLVVSSQRDYIAATRRIYETLDSARRQAVRSWYVYYLQNGEANDVANLLQQAFTPGNVTAPAGRSSQSRQGGGSGFAAGGGMAGGGMMAGGAGGAMGGGGMSGSSATNSGAVASESLTQQGGRSGNAASALLGGLDVLGTAGSNSDANPSGVRIVANETNNALLVYATPAEYDTMQAMLRRIDILPLQVRIDATIAEVTLNDTLRYGTQYFFQSGGLNSILSTATAAPTSAATTPLNLSFPGFFVGGPGQGGAPLAIQALQGITEVNVLSSPQLLVLDNQQAKLQVGSLVPYLSQTSQSTISAGSPVINSVNYLQTGVITQITPRVNSGGLVTLDISQEVSEVDNTASQSSGGINSPTFQNRVVSSRVVVQDGQTIGLAGLIRDSASRGNSGIPGVKDVPLLGFLAGTQANQRTRTELIVLITPHVMHDQRDARRLTQDMRDKLQGAALVPQSLRDVTPSGSTDPLRGLRNAMTPAR